MAKTQIKSLAPRDAGVTADVVRSCMMSWAPSEEPEVTNWIPDSAVITSSRPSPLLDNDKNDSSPEDGIGVEGTFRYGWQDALYGVTRKR